MAEQRGEGSGGNRNGSRRGGNSSQGGNDGGSGGRSRRGRRGGAGRGASAGGTGGQGGNKARGGQGGNKGRGGQGRKRETDPRKASQNEQVKQLEGPIAQVLARLPETQRQVLEYRMGLVDGHPHNLSSTARELGLTMHEAKQVEQRAFEHIREAIPMTHLKKLFEKLT